MSSPKPRQGEANQPPPPSSTKICSDRRSRTSSRCVDRPVGADRLARNSLPMRPPRRPLRLVASPGVADPCFHGARHKLTCDYSGKHPPNGRGNRYLRVLFVQAARVVLIRPQSWERKGSSGRSKPPRASGSEIGLVFYRDVVVEQMLVVLCANLLGPRLLHAVIALNSRPGLVIRVRIIDFDVHFQDLAAIDYLPAFDHMQLFGVGRAETVDERLVAQP